MRTNKHETAVKKVKKDHEDNKVKREHKEPNMGKTKKKMGENNNERLDSKPSAPKASMKKHRMEAMTQEAGMNKPKRSKY